MIGEMIDVEGMLVVELRTYLASVAAADPTGKRGLAAAAVGSKVFGDEKGKDAVAPYVILRRSGPARRMPRAPLARFRFASLAYGRSYTEASTVAGLVSDCWATKGPRRRSAGVAIYLSTEEVGGQASEDPDTSEPFETGIYIVSVPLAQAGG
jgi:hypothetical protein